MHQDDLLYVIPYEGAQAVGPIRKTDIIDRLREGRLSLQARVAPPGASVWTPASHVPEFVAAVQPRPHPRPLSPVQAPQPPVSAPASTSQPSPVVNEAAQYEQRIAALKAELESVEEDLHIQSFGFYRPRYGFPEASDYERHLKQVRDQQKHLLKAGLAWETDAQLVFEGSRAKGRKLTADKAKLMLRAFNGECDAAISRVKYDNVTKLEQRIYKSCEAINKLGHVDRIQITSQYYGLKLEELQLVHEHREKVHEEKELERERREQMREEERAQKELEKAQADAEKHERKAQKELKKARAQLAEATGKQLEKLQGLVERLENELSEALDRKAKAIARAQLTRSGHVYVLSNIGSFGEGVYKIGMTRRFEPLDRVKELGDASVPFFFDVHAMIYCEDAPGLEAALHREFKDRRVNMVNTRREFFRATLEEIRAAVAKHHGQVTFVTHPEAEQYRKSVAMKEAAV